MTTRKEQKEVRYQEILAVGLDLFIRKGYAATKIQDIADAVGMSIGLLFHYFKSKEELYITLIQLGVDGPKQMMNQIPVTDAITFFETCANQTLKYAEESPFTAKMFIFLSDAVYNEGIPEKAKEIAKSLDFYTGTSAFVLKGQSEGTIRQGDAYSLSTLFWTTLQGIIQVYAFNTKLVLPKGEWIVDMIRERKGE